MVQREFFPKEVTAFQKAATAKEKEEQEIDMRSMRKSRILSLDPIYDQENNLIRVGGRLQHSSLDYGRKHPVILPDCHLVRLYLQKLHEETLHGGATLMLSTSRSKIWILQGKNACRQIIRKCVTCTRWKGKPYGQKMGNLPAARLEGCGAFHTVGIDYAGPISLKHRKGRGVPTMKGYIALFICFTTKAIHIEAVMDMTSESFIAALRRFISRRGIPTHIYSDNGTNFVGADKELKKLLIQEQYQQQVSKEAEDKGIIWHFNPPSAPHMGGLWEAGVKSTKHHLRRIMKDALLTFEELSTTLAQIEAQLNSRPLMPLSEDPSCEEVLTPGHFLIGRPINAAPDPDVTMLKENSLSRWQYCQRLSQLFWKRFNNEYITSLQQRQKWQTPTANAEPGHVVLVKEDNTPPGKWTIGRIMQIHPGSDGKVRVATIKTAQGEFKRPVVKLVPLVVDNSVNAGENV